MSNHPPDTPRTPHSVRLADIEEAARHARHTVHEQLGAWGLDPPDSRDVRSCTEAVLLIVSELVTNACRHTRGPRDLRISWRENTVTIEVDDLGAESPVIVPDAGRGAHGGYGMSLIDTLADHWGVQHRGGGKTVYASITYPRDAFTTCDHCE